MKWFTTVFLPSLEDQHKHRGNPVMWITAKQADICKRYMIPSRYIRGAMDYVIADKRFHIQIAPNGCAALTISKDGDEWRRCNP